MPALAELAAYLDALPEPHIVFDRQYRILAANSAYRQCCGAPGPLIGRTCFDVSHHYSAPCDQMGEACPLAQSLASGQRERVLHRHHTSRGEEYVRIELTPVRDPKGEIRYFVERLEPLSGPRVEPAGVIAGQAPALRDMLTLVARVAPSEAGVLLLGESGSGKELVAQTLHSASRRAHAPFVALDCSGIPETLFESELFGHERGAFTGAVQRRTGLVEAASGGTLFLDEVGDIPLTMQVKLLRLLETGSYRRVGSTEPRHADIRVIAATHRDLAAMVAAGTFRADLYYRLNVFPIRVPPLRERLDDLPALAAALLARIAPGRTLHLAPATLSALRQQDFPGNVRELRNLLERAVLLCDGEEIAPAHLHTLTPIAAASGALSRRAQAAALGISERTLYRHLKRQTGSPDAT